MISIAYVGPFWDGTGYSRAACDMLWGLSERGAAVFPKNVKLTQQTVEPPAEILKLFGTEGRPPDAVVQHIPPSLFRRFPGAKNIGFVHLETTRLQNPNDIERCNAMDELWVASSQNLEALQVSGVTIPIKVTFLPYREGRYAGPWSGLDLGLDVGIKFKILVVGDYSQRKNIDAIVRSYFERFQGCDDAILILKTYVPSITWERSAEIVSARCNELWQERNSRSDGRPKVALITQYLTEQAMMNLLSMCDLFVSAERGASWCYPAFDAAAFGKAVVASGWGGHTQFLNHREGALLTGFEMIPINGFEKSKEHSPYWANPNEGEIGDYMWECYIGEFTPDRKLQLLRLERFRPENLDLEYLLRT